MAGGRRARRARHPITPSQRRPSSTPTREGSANLSRVSCASRPFVPAGPLGVPLYGCHLGTPPVFAPLLRVVPFSSCRDRGSFPRPSLSSPARIPPQAGPGCRFLPRSVGQPGGGSHVDPPGRPAPAPMVPRHIPSPCVVRGGPPFLVSLCFLPASFSCLSTKAPHGGRTPTRRGPLARPRLLANKTKMREKPWIRLAACPLKRRVSEPADFPSTLSKANTNKKETRRILGANRTRRNSMCRAGNQKGPQGIKGVSMQ
jgi:hypothetical protein